MYFLSCLPKKNIFTMQRENKPHNLILYCIYAHTRTHIHKHIGNYAEALVLLVGCDITCFSLNIETVKTIESDLKQLLSFLNYPLG